MRRVEWKKVSGLWGWMILRLGWERISAHLGMVLKKASTPSVEVDVDVVVVVDVRSEGEAAGVVVVISSWSCRIDAFGDKAVVFCR